MIKRTACISILHNQLFIALGRRVLGYTIAEKISIYKFCCLTNNVPKAKVALHDISFQLVLKNDRKRNILL